MNYSQERVDAYRNARAAWLAARAISEGDAAPHVICEAHQPLAMHGKRLPPCGECDKLRAEYLALAHETSKAYAAYRRALNSLTYWESNAISSRADLRELARQSGINC